MQSRNSIKLCKLNPLYIPAHLSLTLSQPCKRTRSKTETILSVLDYLKKYIILYCT